MAIVVLIAAAGLERLKEGRPRWNAAIALLLSAAFAVHIPFSWPLERIIQHDIEDQVRKPLAQHLDVVVEPGESVVSESAGYVGYYSDVLLYDYPGLTSPKSRATLSQLAEADRNLLRLAAELDPDWLVLRDEEWGSFQALYPDDAQFYEVDGTWQSEVGSPVRRWELFVTNLDTVFHVLRRNEEMADYAG
jgi:hypothetical protein